MIEGFLTEASPGLHLKKWDAWGQEKEALGTVVGFGKLKHVPLSPVPFPPQWAVWETLPTSSGLTGVSGSLCHTVLSCQLRVGASTQVQTISIPSTPSFPQTLASVWLGCPGSPGSMGNTLMLELELFSLQGMWMQHAQTRRSRKTSFPCGHLTNMSQRLWDFLWLTEQLWIKTIQPHLLFTLFLYLGSQYLCT